MKPRIKIAATQTPSGGEMALFQHDHDFSILVNGKELMNSRLHTSELELARLGCAHLAGKKAPTILIGGLGMGYTLRQALDTLSPDARVVVSELLGEVVEWNRTFLGALNDHPLRDKRVEIEAGDITAFIAQTRDRFDAILLDIDNGPKALTDPLNHRLYGHGGIQACRRALRKQGCLAVWSVEASKKFEKTLTQNDFQVRRYRVPAGKNSKSKSRIVWVASEDKNSLPHGGGEPRIYLKKDAKGSHTRSRHKG